MTRWTEDQYAALMQRKTAPIFVAGPVLARAQLPANKMNKTEAAYAGFLEARLTDRDILWWRREPMKLRLADGSYYKPDFGVVNRDGLFELHETKGFWREASRVRIKVAAELFPFKFIAITRAKTGGWEREEFS